jgi:hypothetical protein
MLAGSLLTVLALSTVALQPDPRVSIATARQLPLGSVVTVEGAVTAPTVFASTFSDKGFAVEDSTARIYVSVVDDLGLKFHQQARVTGTLRDIGGLMMIVPASRSDVQAKPGC